MDWIDTPQSSNIARYSYDKVSQVLTVEFKSGGTYNYYDVPAQIFEGLNAAASKGQFLIQNIKGTFRYARV